MTLEPPTTSDSFSDQCQRATGFTGHVLLTYTVVIKLDGTIIDGSLFSRKCLRLKTM